MAACEPVSGVGRASARPHAAAASMGGLSLPYSSQRSSPRCSTSSRSSASSRSRLKPPPLRPLPRQLPPRSIPSPPPLNFGKRICPAAIPRAVELKALAPAIRANAETAKTKYAPAAGLGTAYYFARGSGKVVARERNTLRLALDHAASEIVTLRIGPIFGNTVRDGSGLLDVNSFPGLQEIQRPLRRAQHARRETSCRPSSASGRSWARRSTSSAAPRRPKAPPMRLEPLS